MKQHYVCGFYFNEDLTKVVLIEKIKPEWQKGKLNGVGGKKESDEDIFQSMKREFEEEAGVLSNGWTSFHLESGDDWSVWFFYNVGPLEKIQTQEEEQIVIIYTDELNEYPLIYNLYEIIPKAIEIIKRNHESI